MSEKKKQHYVPKFYMRFFTENDRFSVLNLSDKAIAESVPYKSQCYKNFFYGKDALWENKLGEMEIAWSQVLSKVHQHEKLTKSDIQTIKQFALYQRQRTLGENEYSIKIRGEMLIEAGKTLCSRKGLPFTKEVEDLCKERAKNSITPAETLYFAEKYEDSIKDLNVLIIDYKAKSSLISSDVPVISINPFYNANIGYGVMGLILLFPNSPSQLIVVYDSKMYPKFKAKDYISSSNEKEVQNLNILQLLSAEKTVFSVNSNDLTFFSKSNWDLRNANCENRKLQALGPSNNKMMIFSGRNLYFESEFSFAKITTSFNDIHWQCREAVPRLYQKEWAEKLKNKGDIVSQISAFQPNILKTLGMTRKQYRKGCKKMYDSAKKYWREN